MLKPEPLGRSLLVPWEGSLNFVLLSLISLSLISRPSVAMPPIKCEHLVSVTAQYTRHKFGVTRQPLRPSFQRWKGEPSMLSFELDLNSSEPN